MLPGRSDAMCRGKWYRMSKLEENDERLRGGSGSRVAKQLADPGYVKPYTSASSHRRSGQPLW